MTHDRADSDELPLRHEFLARMLRVRRAGVSEVRQSLQQIRLIAAGRGRITITERQIHGDVEELVVLAPRNRAAGPVPSLPSSHRRNDARLRKWPGLKNGRRPCLGMRFC